MTQRPTKLMFSSLGACVLCLAASSARADTVSVQVDGALRVDTSAVHLNVDAALDLLGHWDAGLSFGVRFAEPPPPPPPPPAPVAVATCDYRCSAVVPGYYVEERVYVEPSAPIFEAKTPRPLRRWGLGAFAGSLQIEGQEAGSDWGLLGRYRFSPVFALELELAKSQMADGGRVDRHLGSSLLVNLSPRSSFSPFLLAGAGFGQTEIGGGEFHAEQGYAEVGAGLEYKLTASLLLSADVRVGARQSHQDVAYLSTVPVADFSEDEEFTRARIGGLLYF